MRSPWTWMVLALLLDAVLLLSFLSLGIAQASGGDEGMWAVILFYLLIVVAPIVSTIAVWRFLRWAAEPARSKARK